MPVRMKLFSEFNNLSEPLLESIHACL